MRNQLDREHGESGDGYDRVVVRLEHRAGTSGYTGSGSNITIGAGATRRHDGVRLHRGGSA
jgi:hypothetical protein